jgi:hypothetical protein
VDEVVWGSVDGIVREWGIRMKEFQRKGSKNFWNWVGLSNG